MEDVLITDNGPPGPGEESLEELMASISSSS